MKFNISSTKIEFFIYGFLFGILSTIAFISYTEGIKIKEKTIFIAAQSCSVGSIKTIKHLYNKEIPPDCDKISEMLERNY